MQEKIKGIVLRCTKYNDSKQIVSIFTLTHGHQSFVVPRARLRKTTTSNALWQPLSMVEFDCDMHASARLPQPQDSRFYYNYANIRFSPIKSTVAIFLAEFLSAALRGETKNTPLYAYIESSLKWFDTVLSIPTRPAAISNFHLVFLTRMLKFIGIQPNIESHRQGFFFDLTGGIYTPGQPLHSYFIRPDEASFIPQLFRMNYDTMHLFRLSRKQRQRILEVLNTYYRLHMPSFPELKSFEILQEVFD